jgi:hypothetical protein
VHKRKIEKGDGVIKSPRDADMAEVVWRGLTKAVGNIDITLADFCPQFLGGKMFWIA